MLQLCLLLFSVYLILVSQLGLFSMYFILLCYVMLKLNLLFLFRPNSEVVWSEFGLYFASVL